MVKSVIFQFQGRLTGANFACRPSRLGEFAPVYPKFDSAGIETTGGSTIPFASSILSCGVLFKSLVRLVSPRIIMRVTPPLQVLRWPPWPCARRTRTRLTPQELRQECPLFLHFSLLAHTRTVALRRGRVVLLLGRCEGGCGGRKGESSRHLRQRARVLHHRGRHGAKHIRRRWRRVGDTVERDGGVLVRKTQLAPRVFASSVRPS